MSLQASDGCPLPEVIVLLRLPVAAVLMVILLAGLAALGTGCGRSMEKLAPARIALLPGSVGSGADDLIVIAEERFPLRWQGEWIPVQPPRNYERFVTGPGGFLCWSEQANKFSCLYIRDTGDRSSCSLPLRRTPPRLRWPSRVRASRSWMPGTPNWRSRRRSPRGGGRSNRRRAGPPFPADSRGRVI